MCGESPQVYKMGRPTENYKRAKLDQDPSVREEGRLLHKVDELQRDREIREGYEEVRDVLILDEQIVCWP